MNSKGTLFVGLLYVILGINFSGFLAKAEMLPVWVEGNCLNSYTNAIRKLEEVRAYGEKQDKSSGRLIKSSVSFYNASSNNFYNGFPDNAPISIRFDMVGSGSKNVLNSPIFIKNIAYNLIESCPLVSKVVFIDRCQPFVLYGCKPSKGFYYDQSTKLVQSVKWHTGEPNLSCSEKIKQWKYEGWCD